MQKKDAIKQIEYYCSKGGKLICPFNNAKCPKINRSDIGVCSFVHKGKDQIICPSLFNKIDFLDIVAKDVCKYRTYRVYKEVKVGSNFFDYFLVNNENKEDYAAVELQALDSTGNYRWVFGEKAKPFCINWKTTKKTIFAQLITKSAILKKEHKKLVLVVQDTFLDYLNLTDKAFDEAKDVHIVSLTYRNKEFEAHTIHSLSFDELIDVFIPEDADLSALISKLSI